MPQSSQDRCEEIEDLNEIVYQLRNNQTIIEKFFSDKEVEIKEEIQSINERFQKQIVEHDQTIGEVKEQERTKINELEARLSNAMEESTRIEAEHVKANMLIQSAHTDELKRQEEHQESLIQSIKDHHSHIVRQANNKQAELVTQIAILHSILDEQAVNHSNNQIGLAEHLQIALDEKSELKTSHALLLHEKQCIEREFARALEKQLERELDHQKQFVEKCQAHQKECAFLREQLVGAKACQDETVKKHTDTLAQLTESHNREFKVLLNKLEAAQAELASESKRNKALADEQRINHSNSQIALAEQLRIVDDQKAELNECRVLILQHESIACELTTALVKQNEVEGDITILRNQLDIAQAAVKKHEIEVVDLLATNESLKNKHQDSLIKSNARQVQVECEHKSQLKRIQDEARHAAAEAAQATRRAVSAQEETRAAQEQARLCKRAHQKELAQLVDKQQVILAQSSICTSDALVARNRAARSEAEAQTARAQVIQANSEAQAACIRAAKSEEETQAIRAQLIQANKASQIARSQADQSAREAQSALDQQAQSEMKLNQATKQTYQLASQLKSAHDKARELENRLQTATNQVCQEQREAQRFQDQLAQAKRELREYERETQTEQRQTSSMRSSSKSHAQSRSLEFVTPPRPSHSGVSTGQFLRTNGSANGREVFQGERGGLYTITESGNKSYLDKWASFD